MSVPNSAGNLYARNLNVVKIYFKKPMALIISILSLATFILNFVITSKASDFYTKYSSQLLNSYNVQDVSNISDNILSYLFYLITGICVACFFMIYFSSALPNGSPAIFFSVLHVLSVIELISYAFWAVVSVVFGLISILSIETVITFFSNSSGINNSEEYYEQLTRNIQALKPTLFLALVILIAIYAVVLVYINSQTSFLKSCKRSCKEPSLFAKGAKTYGNMSIVLALLMLICLVVLYLSVQSIDNSTIDFSMITTPMLAYFLCTSLVTFLKGSFVKGWDKFAKENESHIYAAAAAASRSPEANPIATFKSTTRKSNDAIKQSQPYLYGEEANNDPNKKSSYIPEELQNDYPPQYVPQNGMMGDPFMEGDPFAQQMNPMGGDHYGQDPFAQSPMGNPYGQQPMDSNGGNPYNNGMM